MTRSFRARSDETRDAVRLATAPEASSTRTLAMSIRGESTGDPGRADLGHRAAVEGVEDLEVVDHQVEDDVDVEAARREDPQPLHLDEARRRCRPPSSACTAGLKNSMWPTASTRPAGDARSSRRSASSRLGRQRLLDQHVEAAVEQARTPSRRAPPWARRPPPPRSRPARSSRRGKTRAPCSRAAASAASGRGVVDPRPARRRGAPRAGGRGCAPCAPVPKTPTRRGERLSAGSGSRYSGSPPPRPPPRGGDLWTPRCELATKASR